MVEILPSSIMLAVGAAAAYVVFRWLSTPKSGGMTAYEQEMNEILTSDKYKVKRKFEE